MLIQTVQIDLFKLLYVGKKTIRSRLIILIKTQSHEIFFEDKKPDFGSFKFVEMAFQKRNNKVNKNETNTISS